MDPVTKRMLDSALKQADVQEQAQRNLQNLLQSVLSNPQLIKRVNMSMCAIVKENDTYVLLVALPSGERWDIPLPAHLSDKLRLTDDNNHNSAN